jgi:hypothetical protein
MAPPCFLGQGPEQLQLLLAGEKLLAGQKPRR